jgi:hypothetical protein
MIKCVQWPGILLRAIGDRVDPLDYREGACIFLFFFHFTLHKSSGDCAKWAVFAQGQSVN